MSRLENFHNIVEPKSVCSLHSVETLKQTGCLWESRHYNEMDLGVAQHETWEAYLLEPLLKHLYVRVPESKWNSCKANPRNKLQSWFAGENRMGFYRPGTARLYWSVLWFMFVCCRLAETVKQTKKKKKRKERSKPRAARDSHNGVCSIVREAYEISASSRRLNLPRCR